MDVLLNHVPPGLREAEMQLGAAGALRTKLEMEPSTWTLVRSPRALVKMHHFFDVCVVLLREQFLSVEGNTIVLLIFQGSLTFSHAYYIFCFP